MKKYLLILLALLTFETVVAQSTTMILTTRNYIHSQRPRFIPFLLDSTTSFYKTSVDSLFIRPVQVLGLKDIAITSDYNDLINKPTIPTNNNQLTNGAGYLTSYTEIDPTVSSYAKGLTSFNSIKSDTDPLYKSSSYVPTWGEIVSKPTFSTVATSGSYNDLSNKPTIPNAQVQSDWNAVSGMGAILNKPTIVQQLGTSYTKEYNTEVNTTTSTNIYTVTATGITTITSVQATGFYSGANTQSAPLVAISSISGNVVTLVVAESATTGVLIGGNVEGLTDFLKVGKIFVTIKGN